MVRPSTAIQSRNACANKKWPICATELPNPRLGAGFRPVQWEPLRNGGDVECVRFGVR